MDDNMDMDIKDDANDMDLKPDAGLGDQMPDNVLMDQNMDDLFGEAADGLGVDALGVGLSVLPIPPALVNRIEEKQDRGCCTKLAWSTSGSIAQITDHGRKVEFRCMLRNPKTKEWRLTEPSKTPIVAPEGTIFEHVHFSGVGIDLAVADNHGHVRVYALVGNLGKMLLSPNNFSQEVDSQGVDVAVGLHWLPVYPTEFKVPYMSPATKIGDKWMTELRNPNTSDPKVHHPADGRSSLLYVTRNAKLRLMYQNDGVWHAASAELEGGSSSSDQLTHAAMAENADHLLLGTHDTRKRFCLYKIAITWNATQHTRPQQPPSTIVAPTLEIARLTVLEHISAQHADLATLSELRLVPPIAPNVAQTDPPSLPTIIAVFTRVPLPVDPTQQHQEAFSIIARWQVETTTAVQHESFAKLKPNGNTAPQSGVAVLRRQEDNITSKVVLSVEPQYHNTILALCASDGTIEFRDRVTMASLEPYGDTTTVSSLPQAGFEHVAGDHVPNVAMSPDGSMLVTTKADDTVSTKSMQLRYSWHPLEDGMSDPKGLIEAAVVCLARQYGILCCASAANDDSLALLPPDLSPELRSLYIREVIEMTNRPMDMATWELNKQQQNVIREPILRVIASAQFVINKKPGTQKPTLMGKFAYIYLNARLCCTVLAQVIANKETHLHPSHLHSLRGVAKWCCDLLCWVADSLITLKRASKTAAPDTPPHQAFMYAVLERDSPILNLFLCTYTRVFLRFMCVTLSRYQMAARQALPTARSVTEHRELEDTLAYFTELPFKFPAFEALMSDVDASVRQAITSRSLQHERRVELELSVMTSTTIPEEYLPVIQHLVGTALPKFMEQIDLPELYFRDTTWLGIEPTREEEGGRREQYDVLRKLRIAKGAKLRVCRRCGSVMEDVEPGGREMWGWVVHAQRTCVCGCYWVMA
ncbi:Mediator of RNA polymerase II transcription subunit 16 [Saxophila tyrrhenica]|uniref:Mediator of RNA polymerase II transcription subunit 16 n=1 Tax=Saxophila tyrrhenica TaxID=1690608 RepID=A0AAV9P6D8_9PEZI|nr:Mediator of RNA polymerase II transcription subunit 16 [Saxophila tyrrhenica]